MRAFMTPIFRSAFASSTTTHANRHGIARTVSDPHADADALGARRSRYQQASRGNYTKKRCFNPVIHLCTFLTLPDPFCARSITPFKQLN